MSGMREYRAALATGLRIAATRPRHLMLVAAGFFIACSVLLILLSLPAGVRQLGGNTGSDTIVMVLPKGSVSEGQHALSVAELAALQSLPGIAHDADGHPLLAPQFVAYAKLRRRDGALATVLLRGVTPIQYELVADSIHLTGGHPPRAGKDEFLAGVGAAATYVAIGPHAVHAIRGVPLRNTGTFRAGSGFWNSEIWLSQDVLQTLYQAPSTISSAWVKLASPAAFPTFMHALHASPRLAGVDAYRQTDFYASQTSFLIHFIDIAAMAVAIVLGLGAILAIANALSMALDARQHELAILRAMGFRSAPLAWALLTEVWLIAALCTGLVTVLALTFWDRHAIASSALFQAIEFKAHVGPSTVLLTLTYGCLIGTLGALLPISRAVRTPLITALGAR